LTEVIGFIAVAIATANVVGGFLVTHRMLGMFRGKDKNAKGRSPS
jgi:NAD(P) transhydrogenase subunit alpha